MYELQDSRYQTVAFGDRQKVTSVVKHQATDGRYRIVGPELQLYCIRIGGKVYPDPERVPLERPHKSPISALQYLE